MDNLVLNEENDQSDADVVQNDLPDSDSEDSTENDQSGTDTTQTDPTEIDSDTDTTQTDPSESDDDLATILSDVKKMLNIQSEVKEFDIDVISHINGAFLTLFQLGVGPEHPFSIDENTLWDSFETQIPKNVIRDYLYLKTKIVFDPPVASNVFEAYKERISELEFRMSIEVDNGGGIVVG